MEAAYIERIAGHAVHRARIVKAAGQVAQAGAGSGHHAGTGPVAWPHGYKGRINKGQIIIEDSLMQFLVHAQYSYCNLRLARRERYG